MASGIHKLIVQNVEKLAKKMIPTVVQMAKDAGIKQIGTLKVQMPDTCLPKPELEKLLQLRNQLMTQLNSVFELNDKLSKITETIQPIVDTTNNSLNIAKTVIDVSTIALKAIPSPPGVPGVLLTGYVDVNNLVNNILPPIITTNVTKISSITKSTDFANKILLKLKNLLSVIDDYLKKCGMSENDFVNMNDKLANFSTTLSSVNGNINGLDVLNTDNTNKNNNNLYKNFIIEIEEIPYTPTVKRRRAVAKNSQNIVLLATPLTFSTDTQTLINEIKLIIDSSNLEAN